MRLVHRSGYKEGDSKGAKRLGLRLRGYRLALGLSQAELARRLGIRQASISLIEHGRRRPSATFLHRFADIFHIDEPLFLLSLPEAKLTTGACLVSRASAHSAVWRAFTNDNALLARNNVQPNELRVLSKVRIIGEVRHPRDFIYILTAIRQALQS